MIKNIVYILCFLFLFFSCKKQETETLQEKFISLNQKYNTVKEESKKIQYSIDTLVNNYEIAYKKHFNKAYMNAVFDKKMKTLSEKTKKLIIDNVSEELKLDEYEFERAITNALYFTNNNYTTSKITYEFDFYGFLSEKFDRKPSSIEALFSNSVKEHIFSLFKGNTNYKNSGVKTIVEALLISYNSFKENDDIYKLESIYEICADDKDKLDRIDKYTHASVVNILSEEGYQTTYERFHTSLESRVFYVYSFWGRRYNEGNNEVVYKLLKEFYNRLTPEDEKHESLKEPKEEVEDSEEPLESEF